MLVLLLSLAFAEETGIKEVDGGVWMPEETFRQYVKDSRNLKSCQESFDQAMDEATEANDRALRAVETARAQFDSDEELIDEQVQTIADLGAKLDDFEDRLTTVKNQRNVAWGIAGGFLAASTAAVVLTLSN